MRWAVLHLFFFLTRGVAGARTAIAFKICLISRACHRFWGIKNVAISLELMFYAILRLCTLASVLDTVAPESRQTHAVFKFRRSKFD